MNITIGGIKGWRLCRALMALAGVLMFNSLAWGSCWLSSGGVGQGTYTLPTTMTVPAGAKVGDKIEGVMSAPASAYGSVDCSTKGFNAGIAMLKFSTPMTPVTGVSGLSNVYKTNVPGIGVQVWSEYSYNGSPIAYVGNSLVYWYSGIYIPTNSWLTGVKLQYYVIGPVSSGTIVLPSPFVEAWLNTSVSSSGAVKYSVLNISGATTIKATSCEVGTTDIYVDMGKHATDQLSSPGDTTDPVSFNIALKDCSDTVTKIVYQLIPTTAILDPTSSVIALDSTSAAEGVGLQLLDDAGNALPLSTPQTYNANGTGDYNIPLQARYYRLNQAISGGTANTSVTFSVEYQ